MFEEYTGLYNSGETTQVKLFSGLLSWFSQEQRLHRACQAAESSVIDALAELTACVAQEAALKSGEKWIFNPSVAKIEHLGDVMSFALVELGIVKAKNAKQLDKSVLSRDDPDAVRDLAIVNHIQDTKLIRLAGGAVFLFRYLDSNKTDGALLERARVLAGREWIDNALATMDGTAKLVKYLAAVIIDRLKKAKKTVDDQNLELRKQADNY